MGDFVSAVSSQIQRPINEAISDQILPQMQATLRAGQGQLPERRWQVQVRGQVFRSEEALNPRFKSNSRDKLPRFSNRNEDLECTPDMMIGDNESPNLVPEYLTGRIPLRTALNQPARENNDLLDTTLAATEQTPPVPVLDPINRLAVVLTNLQNRPTAQQQLTIRPVNSNTMTLDGKSEKFELFEDIFHTTIKMQPELSEQKKINHFYSLLREGHFRLLDGQ